MKYSCSECDKSGHADILNNPFDGIEEKEGSICSDLAWVTLKVKCKHCGSMHNLYYHLEWWEKTIENVEEE